MLATTDRSSAFCDDPFTLTCSLRRSLMAVKGAINRVCLQICAGASKSRYHLIVFLLAFFGGAF